MLPALPVHVLARNLARALAADAVFGGACEARFGKAQTVFMDSTGAAVLDDLYPFVVVSPEREDFGRGERTIAINVLLCIRALGDEPGSAKPVQGAEGFFELPGADVLQDIAAGLVVAVLAAKIGAILADWSADWDFGSEWPEQSALLTFNYKNPFTYQQTTERT